MRIVGYAFEAALHCVACTKRRVFKLDHGHPHAYGGPCRDGNGVEYDAVDREGHMLQAVFSTDADVYREHCDDCRVQLIG